MKNTRERRLAAALLLWVVSFTAAAVQPYPPNIHWEQFLLDEELTALAEFQNNHSRYLTLFNKGQDFWGPLSTVVDAVLSSRVGDAVALTQIIQDIERSQLTVAYVEYKIYRRRYPRNSQKKAMEFFSTGRPMATKAQMLVDRSALYQAHPSLRSKVAGTRLGTAHFGLAGELIFRNLLSGIGQTDALLIEAMFARMFDAWGQKPLPIGDSIPPVPPAGVTTTTYSFVPARDLDEARTLLRIAEQTASQVMGYRPPDHPDVRQAQAEVEFYRREVQRLSY